MKFRISQYAMLAAVFGLAACNGLDDLEYANHNAAQQSLSKSFDVDFAGSLQKAYFMNNGASSDFSFETDDEMSVFANGSNCKFASGIKSEKVSFVGEAANADYYYALFPYQEAATISGNVISANVPAEFTALKEGKLPMGALSVGYTSNNDKSFHLHNASAIITLLLSREYDKVEITASKNIAGDVQITVADDGMPSVGAGTAKTIIVNTPNADLKQTNIGVLPVGDVDITLKYYNKDGSTFQNAYKGIKLERSKTLLFSRAGNHTITFQTGVEGYTIDPIKVQSGKVSAQLPAPEQTPGSSFNFKGWRDSQDNVYSAGSSITVTSDMALVAEWSKNPVLSFSSDVEAVLPSPQEFKAGEAFSLPTDVPTAEYYKFAGWSFNGTTYQPGNSVTFDKSVELLAVWNFVDTKVSINADGGTSPVAEWSFPKEVGAYFYYDESKMYMVSGSDVLEEALPTRKGYVFNGFVASNGTELDDRLYAKTSHSIKALWLKEYTITFKDAQNQVLNIIIYTSKDLPLELSCELPVYDGKFVGWNGSDGKTYEQGDALSVVQNLTLTAQYKKLITVKFNGNGNKQGSAPESISDYDEVELPGAGDMARKGFSFAGWNTKMASPDAEYSAGDKITLPGVTILYAIWKERKFLIKYHYNLDNPLLCDNQIITGMDMERGNVQFKAYCELPEGYVLKHWVDSNGNTYRPGSPIDIDDGLELFPVAEQRKPSSMEDWIYMENNN